MLLLADHNRVFGYAVAASLVLHALVLAVRAPALRTPPTAAPEPPLVARLVEPAPPAPPAPAPPPPLVQKPESPKPLPPKRLARPRPKAIPRPMTKQEEPRQESVPAPSEAPAPAAPAAPASPPAPPVVAIAPPAAPVTPAPDPAAALAHFRQELVALAVRYKRYPRVALDNGWTGDVLVRIDIDANGAVTGVRVKTSSGFEVLDGQALEMFRKAAPEVTVPAALRGRGFSVEVRAIYNLQDRPG